jgi:hypothetical protein
VKRARERLVAGVARYERNLEDALAAKRELVRCAAQPHELHVPANSDAERVAELALEVRAGQPGDRGERLDRELVIEMSVDMREHTREPPGVRFAYGYAGSTLGGRHW